MSTPPSPLDRTALLLGALGTLLGVGIGTSLIGTESALFWPSLLVVCVAVVALYRHVARRPGA